MCRTALSLLWLVLHTRGVWCLKVVSLHVPSRVVIGDNAKLSCGFDLEGKTLYSIKWYREDVEFFRYVPGDKPPGQSFPMKGVNVNMQYSVNETVLLENIDERTSGKYKCEVSADAPSFQTEAMDTHLIVRDFYESCSHPMHYSLLLMYGPVLLLHLALL